MSDFSTKHMTRSNFKSPDIFLVKNRIYFEHFWNTKLSRKENQKINKGEPPNCPGPYFQSPLRLSLGRF